MNDDINGMVLNSPQSPKNRTLILIPYIFFETEVWIEATFWNQDLQQNSSKCQNSKDAVIICVQYFFLNTKGRLFHGPNTRKANAFSPNFVQAGRGCSKGWVLLLQCCSNAFSHVAIDVARFTLLEKMQICVAQLHLHKHDFFCIASGWLLSWMNLSSRWCIPSGCAARTPTFALLDIVQIKVYTYRFGWF